MPVPAELLAFARQLRESQTDAETFLWYLLRDRRFLGLKFRRQHPVRRYVLDFYCHDRLLAVELDGGGHLEANQAAHDAEREEVLRREGIRVLRFWNDDVLLHTESVLESLYEALKPLTPAPLPPGEGIWKEKD